MKPWTSDYALPESYSRSWLWTLFLLFSVHGRGVVFFPSPAVAVARRPRPWGSCPLFGITVKYRPRAAFPFLLMWRYRGRTAFHQMSHYYVEPNTGQAPFRSAINMENGRASAFFFLGPCHADRLSRRSSSTPFNPIREFGIIKRGRRHDRPSRGHVLHFPRSC